MRVEQVEETVVLHFWILNPNHNRLCFIWVRLCFHFVHVCVSYFKCEMNEEDWGNSQSVSQLKPLFLTLQKRLFYNSILYRSFTICWAKASFNRALSRQPQAIQWYKWCLISFEKSSLHLGSGLPCLRFNPDFFGLPVTTHSCHGLHVQNFDCF